MGIVICAEVDVAINDGVGCWVVVNQRPDGMPNPSAESSPQGGGHELVVLGGATKVVRKVWNLVYRHALLIFIMLAPIELRSQGFAVFCQSKGLIMTSSGAGAGTPAMVDMTPNKRNTLRFKGTFSFSYKCLVIASISAMNRPYPFLSRSLGAVVARRRHCSEIFSHGLPRHWQRLHFL
jgi:hypothetical protein